MTIKLNKETKDKLSYQYEMQRIIVRDHKKILDNPNMTLLSWKYYSRMQKIWLIYMIVITLLVLFGNFSWLMYSIYIVFVVFTIWFIYRNYTFKKLVRKVYENRKEGQLTINKKEIILEKEGQKFSLNWEIVEFILISHFSIAIIPKKDYTPMGLPIEYKEEFLNALEKEKINIKVIDNSANYK